MSTTWSFAWKRLHSIWTIPDLRNKILITLGLLLVFRILAAITVPLTHQEQVNLVNLFGSPRSQNLGQFFSRVGGNQLLSSAALLIVVGMVLDTFRQLDAQMVMRNYSGFLS
jgi:preprotein translocase subunit SecY